MGALKTGRLFLNERVEPVPDLQDPVEKGVLRPLGAGRSARYALNL